MICSYTVNTIPPLIYITTEWLSPSPQAQNIKKLTTNRASRGVVPVQNLSSPSSVKIRYAQWNEFRYAWRASKLCIRVLITLRNTSVNERTATGEEGRTRGAWLCRR